MKVLNYIVLLSVICGFVLNANAQDDPIATFVSKRQVRLDEVFVFEIAMTEKGSLQAPSLKDFSIISGPAISSMSETYSYNGNTRHRNITRYSYQLKPLQKGAFTIESAKLTTKSKTYKSKPIIIEVLEPGNPNYNKSLPPRLLIQPSKTKIYLGEPLVLTYSIYHNFIRASITSDNFPEQTNCWKHFIDPGNKNWEEYMDVLEGHAYGVNVFKKEIIIPNKEGKFTITPFGMTILGRDQYAEQYYDLKSSSPTIDVRPLPKPIPTNFCDAVGTFTCQASLSKKELKTGEAFDLIITIKGKGNINFVHVKKPTLPNGFDVFDAEEKDNITYSENGISGSRTFTFPIMAREPGHFDFTSLDISYFDIEKEKYRTFETPALQLKVTGKALKNSSSIASTKIEIKDTSFHSIRTVETISFAPSDLLFGKRKFYFALLTLPLLSLVLLVFIRTRPEKDEAYYKRQRKNKASKFAIQKLALAQQALTNQDTNKFYEETYKALLHYLHDKFSIETSQMNTDFLRSHAEQFNMNANQVELIIQIINRCEMVRFGAVLDDDHNKLYSETLQLIDELEAT